jgi:hypothetical protein
MGSTAIGASWVASTRADPGEWLATWLAEAVLALAVGGFMLVRKAGQQQPPGLSQAGRQFAGNFAPPICAGAILTPVLYRAGLVGHLPGVWLLLYGTAVTTAGAFSIRVVPVMGACIMVVGAVALTFAPAHGNLFMALGFGVVQVLFGLLIARKYGG